MRIEKVEVPSTYLMMKYFCEICNTEYAYANQADYCEKKHLQATCQHSETYLEADIDSLNDLSINCYCKTCNSSIGNVAVNVGVDLENNQNFLMEFAELINKYREVEQ